MTHVPYALQGILDPWANRPQAAARSRHRQKVHRHRVAQRLAAAHAPLHEEGSEVPTVEVLRRVAGGSWWCQSSPSGPSAKESATGCVFYRA